MLGVGVTMTAIGLDDGGRGSAKPSDLEPIRESIDYFSRGSPHTDAIPEHGPFFLRPDRDELRQLFEGFRDDLTHPQELRDQLERLFDDPEFFFDDNGMGRFLFEIPPGEGSDDLRGFGFEFRPPSFGFPSPGSVDELLEAGRISEEEAEQLRQALELLDEILQREPGSSS
ncbi:MAG: hypothetical protein OEM94_11055 [Acidimicrobiia bacterium]|nr:hypothetical protein [Acidimicrobiia bacterium]